LRAISSRSTPCIAKKTFEAAAEAQAHLIVQLKDNQPTLCRKVEAVCNDTKPLSCVQTVAVSEYHRAGRVYEGQRHAGHPPRRSAS
jgi:hypothetical protein